MARIDKAYSVSEPKSETKMALDKLQQKLNFKINESEISKEIKEALLALAFVQQETDRRIRKKVQQMSGLENTKSTMKGSTYAIALEWIGLMFLLLWIPIIFTLPREDSLSIDVVSAMRNSVVINFTLIGLLLIVFGALAEYYTKSLRIEKIEREINAMKDEIRRFSGQIQRESDQILEKLAEKIRNDRELVHMQTVKKKMLGYLMAYKEVKLKELAQRFDMSIEKIKNILSELLERGEVKGKINYESLSFLPEK